MDTRVALVGIAFLVVSGFWAVVLTVLPYGIGVIVVLSAIFAVFLATGVHLLVSSTSLGSGRTRDKKAQRALKELAALDMAVLQLVSQRKTKEEIVSATGVSRTVVEEKLETLTKGGYLSENSLSEKGFEALKASS